MYIRPEKSRMGLIKIIKRRYPLKHPIDSAELMQRYKRRYKCYKIPEVLREQKQTNITMTTNNTFKVEELARIKMNDVQGVEMIRKRIGIKQSFICRALGIGETNWSTWVTQSNKIPERYHEEIINILTSSYYASKAIKVLPVNGKATKLQKQDEKIDALKVDIELIRMFIEKVANPTINALEDREQALTRMLSENAEEAREILDIIKSHEEKL